MGTRNLTIVVLDGKVKVAQYCQWDGYCEGQGATVLEFLKSIGVDNYTFKEYLRKCEFVSDEYIQNRWEDVGAINGSATMEVSDKFKKNHPQFHRDLGAGVLEGIASGKFLQLKNDIEFAADSLFCEWAYVVDMDNHVLEIYRGFNKSPLHGDERFAYLQETVLWHEENKGRISKDKEYYPIKLAKSYFFTDLPKSAEQMGLDCRTPDEIEEQNEV
jgi:hypothetical protein